ncbi:MAG: Proton/glutamate-aspartate symporter [Fimbriimonadaceae bacterium]|nr:Proton/glutamate-aspartate symporter [Fimbriimonadaceae bacterium]
MTFDSGKGRPLHVKILVGLILGAVAGAVAQNTLGPDNPGLKTFIEQVARPVGQIFLNMIFMVVVPLLFSALVLGIAEIGDVKKIGRVGLRSLFLTLVLSGLAVALGLILVNAFKPGEGIDPQRRAELLTTFGQQEDAAKKVEQSQQAKGFGETIAEFLPKNPIDAASRDDGLLAFMVFSLIFGIALANIAPEKALPVISFLEGIFAISQKIIEFAMKLAPYGVFALIFSTAAVLGVDAFVALGKYAGLVLFALAFHLFVVYSLALKFIAKRNPVEFFRQIRTVMLTAFATASSNATLPTALRSAQEDVGLPRNISSFVLTVGATANQNGTALFEGITILFLAQFFGVPLDLGQQMMVMGLAILAGVGTAGVPGGAWPMIAVILAKIGVPPTAIALCLGIDRILDMSRTVLNVTGDITIAACVAEQEQELPDPAEV